MCVCVCVHVCVYVCMCVCVCVCMYVAATTPQRPIYDMEFATHLKCHTTHLECDTTHLECDTTHLECDTTRLECDTTHLECHTTHLECDTTHLECHTKAPQVLIYDDLYDDHMMLTLQMWNLLKARHGERAEKCVSQRMSAATTPHELRGMGSSFEKEYCIV